MVDQHQSVKEEVKRVADIVEVIGKAIHLKRAGQNFLGLCPFHPEKTPSFTVSPSKQIFHCFGCRKGGDVFTFWMEYHKVSFPEALRDLAERYHVSLPQTPWSPSENEKWAERASLLKVNETACSFYHGNLLQSADSKKARKYLAARGITQEIVSRFKLGYASEEWEGLCRVIKRGDLDWACKAGLVIPRKTGGYYDRFRGRIMFPISDVRGRILGFGGRVLDDSTPKYMNTPESVLFHKGHVLYGFHASHEAIRQSGRAVIVEGYMDLLALKRHGFEEGVATLGTALTKEHVRLLRGYAKEAVVVFDSDNAGRAAASKAFSIFLDEEFPAKAVLLPENEDPDSFVNKHGLSAFQDLLTRATPIFDFFLDLQMAQTGRSIEGRLGILKQTIPLLCELKNAAQQSLYVKRVTEKLDLKESSVLEEMKKWVSSDPEKEGKRNSEVEPIGKKPVCKFDSIFLNILVHHPSARSKMLNEDFRVLLTDQPVKEIFDRMIKGYGNGVPASPSELVDNLDGERSKEVLRETMISRSMCSEEEVVQALKDYENKVLKIQLAESKKRASKKDDLQELSKISKTMQERWG
jgi:DNA primase